MTPSIVIAIATVCEAVALIAFVGVRIMNAITLRRHINRRLDSIRKSP